MRTLRTFGTLFTGGGGADLGLMAAGLVPLWGVEIDQAIGDVYRRNLGDHLITANVCGVDYAALPAVDWLHASPVCTRASVANANATESSEDLAIAGAVARAIGAIQPAVFTLENVFAYRRFESFALILAALERAGYVYDFEHVNFADLGVPQTRKRLILRASRGLLPALPAPVPWVGWYAAIADLVPTLPESKLAPWQLARLSGELRSLLFSNHSHTASDAPSFVEAHQPVFTHEPATTVTTDGKPSHAPRAVLFANGKYDGRLISAAAGEPANTITSNDNQTSLRAVLVEGDDNSGEFGVVTVNGDEPSFSMRAGRSAVHRAILPARVVAMTSRALARFQSLPDSYILPEKRTLAAKVIGNAVPPLAMQRIAEQLIDAVRGL